ncbi:MAG: TrkA family potassium uptake protein [Candidatus Omnitrophota bacterium]
MRQFAVIGLGRFGASVALTLSEKKHQVLAIDADEGIVQDMSDSVTQAVCLDATDIKALRAVGIDSVDIAVCAIGNDLKASILTTMNLKEIGIKQIVCKAQDEKQKLLLEKIGATRVVLPEREMGIRVANSLMASKVIEHIELSDDSSIAELIPPQSFLGKNLREIDVRARYGLNVIGIKRRVKTDAKNGEKCETEAINMSPKASDVIDADSILVVLGSNEDIDKFKKEHK